MTEENAETVKSSVKGKAETQSSAATSPKMTEENAETVKSSVKYAISTLFLSNNNKFIKKFTFHHYPKL